MPHRGLACHVRWIDGRFWYEVQALEVSMQASTLIVMTTREDDFELRLGRIGHERSSNLARVRATVRQRAGVTAGQRLALRPRPAFARTSGWARRARRGR